MNMKKTVAIILILTLSLACVSLASAEKGREYNSGNLARMKTTSAKLTGTKSSRIVTAAFILLECAMAARDGTSMLDRLDSSGICFIARYGSCVDIYYPARTGGYLNLFVKPGSVKIKDYGFGAFSAGFGYVYDMISMKEVWTQFHAYMADWYSV